MDLNKLVTEEFPYPIAFHYRELLKIKDWEKKTRKGIYIFEITVRAITCYVLSEYLIEDLENINNPEFDRLLLKRLGQASLGQWVGFLFDCLATYQDKREQFFIPELYDFYWDTAKTPHRKKEGVRNPFLRLVEIRNDLAHHRLVPKNDAGWMRLGVEVLQNLQTIFGNLAFLQDYDLIRVTNQQDDQYLYERYTGLVITGSTGKLHFHDEPQIGLFYLLRRDADALCLRPLLIFMMAPEEPEPRDVAFYDNLTAKYVEYFATVIIKIIREKDVDLLAIFHELFFYNLEHVKLAVKKAVLSWSGLRGAARALTDNQIEMLKEKYNPELYLQRQKAFRQFQEFLASEKTCFVLVGKSGVGKTNFVLSLVDEYSNDNQAAVILLNAAWMNTSEPIWEMINTNLAEWLMPHQENPADLLMEFVRRGLLQDKFLVVIFDAINENVDGKVLLRRIDQFAGERTLAWLKVVITSRPEAWRKLSAGLPLAEGKYYYDTASQFLPDTGEKNLTTELELFDEGELALVYEKYRQQYNLQSDFSELRSSVKTVLRDPIILRLVAIIYKDQRIPPGIQLDTIYDLYIKELLSSHRLARSDLGFLEHDLMPLMISNDHYENKITADRIHIAEASGGFPLWELIFSDDLYSNGERVNAAFTRLIDAEILTGSGTVLDYVISFKFERFYDYFGGAQIHRLYQKNEEPTSFFINLIQTAKEKPFLIGSIRCALARILVENKPQLVMELAAEPSPEIRDMVVTVLGDYGRSQLQLTKKIIDQLYPCDRISATASNREISAGLVALRVSGLLGFSEVLERGIRSEFELLRSSAIRQIYVLWESDRSKGWQVLDGMISEIKQTLKLSNLIKDAFQKKMRLDLLESAGWISFFILLNNYRETGTAKQLQEKWCPVISEILHYHKRGSLQERILGPVRDFIVSALIDIVIARMRAIPIRYNPAGLLEFRHFYLLPQGTREKTYQLTAYLDPQYGNEGEMEQLIMELYSTQDGLVNQIIGHILVARGLVRLSETIQLTRKIFDLALNSSRPGVISGNMLWVMAMLLMIGDSTDEQIFEVFRSMCHDCLEKVREWHSPIRAYATVWFDDYARVYVRKFGSSSVDLLEWYASRTVEQKDWTMLSDLLYCVGRLAGSPYWRVVLEVVKNLKAVDDQTIRDKIVNLLATIRASQREFVDDYLTTYFLDTDIRQRVLVRHVDEGIFDIYGGGSGPWVEFSNRVLYSPGMQADLIWIAQTAARSKDFNHTLKALAKWGINKIYGEKIFTVSNPG